MHDRTGFTSSTRWIAGLVLGTMAAMLIAVPVAAKDGQRGNGKGRMARWEAQYGFNLTPGNAAKDADEDGLRNGREFAKRTNPLSPDTDADGASDLDEVKGHTDPLDPADVVAAGDSEAKEEDCVVEEVETDEDDDPEDVDDGSSDDVSESSAEASEDSASCDSADSEDSVDSEDSEESEDSVDSEDEIEDGGTEDPEGEVVQG